MTEDNRFNLMLFKEILFQIKSGFKTAFLFSGDNQFFIVRKAAFNRLQTEVNSSAAIFKRRLGDMNEFNA